MEKDIENRVGSGYNTMTHAATTKQRDCVRFIFFLDYKLFVYSIIVLHTEQLYPLPIIPTGYQVPGTGYSIIYIVMYPSFRHSFHRTILYTLLYLLFSVPMHFI